MTSSPLPPHAEPRFHPNRGGLGTARIPAAPGICHVPASASRQSTARSRHSASRPLQTLHQGGRVGAMKLFTTTLWSMGEGHSPCARNNETIHTRHHCLLRTYGPRTARSLPAAPRRPRAAAPTDPAWWPPPVERKTRSFLDATLKAAHGQTHQWLSNQGPDTACTLTALCAKAYGMRPSKATT
jgi:hypothetical protein